MYAPLPPDGITMLPVFREPVGTQQRRGEITAKEQPFSRMPPSNASSQYFTSSQRIYTSTGNRCPRKQTQPLSPQICCRRLDGPFQNFCFQRRAYFRLEKGTFLLNIWFQIPEILAQIFSRKDPTSSEASSCPWLHSARSLLEQTLSSFAACPLHPLLSGFSNGRTVQGREHGPVHRLLTYVSSSSASSSPRLVLQRGRAPGLFPRREGIPTAETPRFDGGQSRRRRGIPEGYKGGQGRVQGQRVEQRSPGQEVRREEAPMTEMMMMMMIKVMKIISYA